MRLIASMNIYLGTDNLQFYHEPQRPLEIFCAWLPETVGGECCQSRYYLSHATKRMISNVCLSALFHPHNDGCELS